MIQRCAYLLMPFCLLADMPDTMLSLADKVSHFYEQDVAKAPPPPNFPLVESALETASMWLSLDPNNLPYAFGASDATQIMAQDATWDLLQDIGFDGLLIEKTGRTDTLSLAPSWNAVWPKITEQASLKQIALFGSLVPNATVPGKDFIQALQNTTAYRSLYHTIEINPKDWHLLPNVPKGSYDTNVPWLTLQSLQRQGYVPESYTTYIKESAWNATDQILGADGKTRRWIYLKEDKNRPVLAWLSPSFSAYRLAIGGAINSIKNESAQMLYMDGNIPNMAQELLALWVRKLNAFTTVTTDGTLESMQNNPADLMLDSVTRIALLHAVLTQNAEALRMIYRLLLENQIDTRRLVHVLQPFDQYSCDWVMLMNAPHQKFRYFEEQITGDLLRKQLLSEDIANLTPFDKVPPSTWVDSCARALGFKNFEKHKEEIANVHALLAFTYAMQPGAFSISSSDLLGLLPTPQKNLGMAPQTEPHYLYDPLPLQMKNPKSFASKIRALFSARVETNIAGGELIAILPSPNPGTLLLLSRLPKNRFLYLQAINFARHAVKELIEDPSIASTYAIDILPKTAEEKSFLLPNFLLLCLHYLEERFISNPNIMIKNIAVVCAQGIGDGLIFHIAAHNLSLLGHNVTTFSDHLHEFGSWLEGYQFAPQPLLSEIPSQFQKFDLIILQHDNSPKARAIKLFPNVYTFYAEHKQEKHGPLTSFDYVCDRSVCMVENLKEALTGWFTLSSKENGLIPPQGLQHRKYPLRIAIHPGSSVEEKNWPLAHFEKVGCALEQRGYEPIFLTQSGTPLCPTLETLASFLYESGGFIGNDSGPGHLASYLQIPSLIIGSNSTHFRLWKPGWHPATIITPPTWAQYFTWTKRRWKSFLPVNKITSLLNKL